MDLVVEILEEELGVTWMGLVIDILEEESEASPVSRRSSVGRLWVAFYLLGLMLARGSVGVRS